MLRPMVILWICIFAVLAGCDQQSAANQQKKLPLPKGESTLDALLRKSQAPAAAPPHLMAEPTSVTFPPLAPDGIAERTIVLRNEGGASLELGPLRLAAQSADFTLGGTCRAGQPLPPGGSCQLEIAYHPHGNLASLSEIVVDQGAAGPSLMLPLSGAGQLVAPVQPAAAPSRARDALTYDRTRQMASLTLGAAGNSADAKLSEEDYSDAGLPGVVSSLPLDRSRVLTADRYIPAVLETTINSQLPGRVIAVVERPVFGEDGRMVLIPAGSRVIGHYKAQAKYGLARLDISWSRILRPDGVSINLEADAADVMGRAGVPGDLDQRLWAKYGSSFLVSVIGAAADWALADNSTQVTSALGSTSTVQSGRTQAANRFGNDMDKLAERIVQDNIDIRPVLTVPAGTKLVIIPTEDLWLRDPEHLRPITQPKDKSNARQNPMAGMRELLPGLAELLLQTPAVQKAAPQTAQQILQSSLLQSLKSDGQ